ncbi:MAG TPA: hypothetical protein DHV28_11925 [Ignavibacteriales bacterium]|nr:hypothetical protein [Ignavibacteriales bacterium]
MKKTISIICILAVLNYIGCSSKEVMTKNTFISSYVFLKGDNSNDIFVNTLNDDQYFFASGHYTFEADSLSGKGMIILPNKKGNFSGKIAFADILTVEQEASDTGNTILLVVGILLTGALIFVGISAAAFSSSVNSCTESVNRH